MREIKKPAEPTYFLVHGPNVTHVGITQTNQVTTTGQPNMESSPSGREFAQIVSGAGKVDDLPPMPETSEWCEQDAVYAFDGKAYVCYQGHWRTEHHPDTVPALFGAPIVDGEAWRQPAGAHDAYPLGAVVTHNEQTWTSTIQANVWEPGVYGWETEVVGNEWTAGVTYSVGDVVTYEGAEYECRQGHTAQVGWEPPNVLALWLPL